MISKDARVETTQIGSNVDIAEFSVIRSNVEIGDNCVIHPHVVIESGVVLRDNIEIFPGAYIGKEPKGAGATARPIKFDTKVIIDSNCSIGPHAVIYYDVEIGNNTLIGDGATIREMVKIGHHCIIGRYVTINYDTKIGNHTKIMDMAHITGKVLVGDNVFISMMVSNANDNNLIERLYNEDSIQGPEIDDDASIGVGAILLPGVKIGKGALVGAGAVVTKDVEPFTVVMGVPAQFVRKLKY